MQTTHDVADPARFAALNAVLGRDGDAPGPFAHQVLFWDARPADALGADGHPKTGGLIPDFGLPRRMWAGGQLEFLAPLKPGVETTKVTKVTRAERKEGRSGSLAFVTLTHEISQGALCVREHQDLVYREAYDPATPRPAAPDAPDDATLKMTRKFTTTELFRYSALTHNGHRIHYDRDYAIKAEGYAGLVVHGPLLAQHLMLMAEAELGSLSQFKFRATSPLMDFEEALFAAKYSGDGLVMWVAAPDGRQCMTATARGVSLFENT